jgi:hypothetical protein
LRSTVMKYGERPARASSRPSWIAAIAAISAIWDATPSNAAQSVGHARRGLCKSGIFRTRTEIFFFEGADCPTLCAKTSMVPLRVIAALEWGLSVICDLRRMHLVRRALLREIPYCDCTRLATILTVST